MTMAKVFKSRSRQVVRLPKAFWVESEELEISRRGDEIILRERAGTMARAFDLLAALPADLTLAGRKNDKGQKRDARKFDALMKRLRRVKAGGRFTRVERNER